MATAEQSLAQTLANEAGTQSAAARENLLINIDNGGTLTDICVLKGDAVYRTKTITTPYDLTRCLFEGLRKVSAEVYGSEELQRLLLDTEYIRYSTTQGTNALVERKGPRLGLILVGAEAGAAADDDMRQAELFMALVGDRSANLDVQGEGFEEKAIAAVNSLTAAGANRLIVAAGGANASEQERELKSLLLRKFPPHMLGAVPILYAHEVSQDADDKRCIWTALFNAFLHPAMEHFLYNAEHKLRELKSRNPLLIFRNDGNAARVARTIAIKTYSSGPRGGAEGAMALARHYGLDHLVSVDIGGTTTDLSIVEQGAVRTARRGNIQGVETSFPLCDIASLGVGGSSIISVTDGQIRVGPESAGGEPGPACFGLGGTDATITDAFLVKGLLDPASYFGGELQIDVERARAAIKENVADPLGVDVDEAAERMEAAWADKVADGIRDTVAVGPQSTLAAFGGAGPFVICRIAESLGISQVMIPGLAAVFSAYGIGFSDIGHEYEAPLASGDELDAVKEALQQTATRGMFAEGFELADCQLKYQLHISEGGEESSVDLAHGLPVDIPAGAKLSLSLRVEREIAHASMSAKFGEEKAAAQMDGQRQDMPLYRAESQPPGAGADGPAVLEEAYFTARIDAGWSFEINAAGDILLKKGG